ncbi:MAG: gliding motility-associated C-terminal domain-containing protein, partial [Flavobacteriales bacterium]
GCLPVLVNFNADTDADDAIAGVVWDFGDLGSSNLVHSTSHNYLTSGVYDVSLTITSEIGCVYTNTEEEQIAIYRWPLADFTTDPTTAVLPNTSFDFINYSNNADDYFWTFDDYGDSEEINPEFTFPEGQLGVYTVSLNAINEWGCTDSIARQVVVIEDFILYAPNAFTPDNDGINDFWYATGIDVDPDEYEVQIYNRWGEVVFLSTDLNEIWDGSVNNGEYFAEDGVYNFRIETRSLTTSDPKEIIGHITLIR